MVKLRQRKLKDGRISLYLDIILKGERKTESLGLYITNDKQKNRAVKVEADKIRVLREESLMYGETSLNKMFNKDKDFLIYFDSIAKQKNNVSVYRCGLYNLRKYSGGKLKVSDITSKWIEEYKQWLLKRVSQNSTHIYLMTLKVVIKKAIQDDYLSSDLLIKFENVSKKEVTKDYLTIEEVQQIANTPFGEREIKKAFLFSCFTGLRWSDVYNLKWDSIKGDTLEITVVKTKRELSIPLSETAKNLLFSNEKTLRMPDERVFKLPTYSTCLIYTKELCEKAGITKNITFHNARHTFGTLSVNSGISAEYLKELLGHRDIKTTQIYYKITGEAKREAISKLPNIVV